MRSFLLLAAATLVVVSASAQLPANKVQSNKVTTTLPAATYKHYQEAPAKNVGQPTLVARRAFEKPIAVTPAMKSSMKSTAKFNSRVAAPAQAPAVQEKYEAFGTNASTEKPETWEMLSGVAKYEDGTTATILTNVIPSPFSFDVEVEYTFTGTEITIEPQLVASGPASDGTMLYIYLESATSSDGTITLALDDNGGIKGSYTILYGAYSSEGYVQDDYLGYYSYFRGIKYNLPGVTTAPVVSFEPSNLVLYASSGLNGYSFNNNLAMTSGYATVNFQNLTSDPATAWNWTVEETDLMEEDEEAAVTNITADTQDFAINTKGYVVYHNPQLIGFNKEKESEPFILGVGKYKDEDDGSDRYTDTYIYTYQTEDDFSLNNETNAIITRQDPDGDLTFYTNWGTPDKGSNPMSKVYIYHDKPATPLYLNGVTIPLVSSSYEDNFNLHIRIVKCSDNLSGRPELGEVIAEGDATIDNVNQDFDSGLTAIEFRELYTEDEVGMSTTLDYLFIDSPFMIIIDGWDNGTFSGVMGSQDVPLDNARTSTWFEMQGEEGSMYSYTSWKTSLFVGLLGVDNGWLYTEDDTNITLSGNGEEKILHISPKYYANGDDGPETALWLDENIIDNEVPDWLELSYTSPTVEGDEVDSDFDLTITAQPLPAGVTSRTAKIVLMQWGAQLTLDITQGEGDEDPIFKPFAFDSADGKYYLANVATSKFWGAGNDWGTQASLVEHPEYVTLLKQPDGTYQLESQVSNGGTAYYFNGDFMDNASPVNLTITATQILGYQDEEETIPVYAYTIANGDNYYGWDGQTTVLGKNLPADSENALWVIATEEDAIASLAEATADTPMDATFLLLDPNFSRNNRNQSAWTGDGFSVGGDNLNMNAEKWGGNSQTFNISQTVNVPNGLYKLSWNGFYRYNNTTDNTNDIAVAAHADGTEVINSFIYANDSDYPLTSIADEAASAALEGKLPFSQSEASAAFGQGLYAQSANVIVKDGKLTVGIKKTNHPGCDWTVWDNFTLLYYGETTNNPDDPELVAPEGWTSVISNGNLAGNVAVNYIAKEYPSTQPVPANIVDGAGKNNSRGVVVKSQDKVSEAWDSQFWIQFNEKLPEGTKLHVEFDYRADNAGNVSTQAHGAPGAYQHWAAIGDVTFGTEWSHFSNDIVVSGDMATGNGGDGFLSIALNLNDITDANTFYFDNFGVWMQKPAPVEDWTDILTNGDMEGTVVKNFFSKEYPSEQVVPSRIVDGAGVDGSRGIEVDAAAKVANDWDSQFWIYLPATLPEGTKYKVEFDYRADRNASADTQAHAAPGDYIFYSMIGSPAFTTEWQHYNKEGSISADQASNADGLKFQSIAFNLSKDSENAVKFFFDNVHFYVQKGDSESGITNVSNSNKHEGVIYNLRGQQVKQAQKGLYIINGKKVVK